MTIIGTIPPGKPGLNQVEGVAQIEVSAARPSRPTTFDKHQQHLERHDQPEREALQTTAEGLPFVYVDDSGHFIVCATDRDKFEGYGYRVCGTVSKPGQLPCFRMTK